MSQPRYNSEGHLPYGSEPYNDFDSDTYGAPPTHPQSSPGQYVPFSHRHSESSASGAPANDYFAHPAQPVSPRTSYNGFAPTPDSGYSGTPSIGTALASPSPGMPSRYRRPVSGNYAKPAYTPLRYDSRLGPDQLSQQPRNRPVSYQHPPVISAGRETSAFQESIDTLVEQSYRQDRAYMPSVPDLAFYEDLKSMDNPNNSQPQLTPMSPLELEGTIPYHGGWLPGHALVAEPNVDQEAHGEIQPLKVKKNPGIQITVDDVVKEVENLKVTDEAPSPGFEAGRNSKIGDPNVDTNSEIYVGSDDELVDSELEVEDAAFNYRTWKPFREFDWSAVGEDEHERVDELCEKLVDATSWKKKADIALEIMRPILEYGDEMLSVRGWVEGEVRQIFREAEEFPTGRVFDPTRYIANEEYDKGYVAKSVSECCGGREGEGGGEESEVEEKEAEDHEGDNDDTESSPEICDHDNCACWFEVTPEAGIQGFPATSRHRKAAIEYIHSFISELLMRLVEYGSETELFTMDYEIDLETLLVHVGGDEARWDEDDFDSEDEVDDDEDDEDNVDERIVALEAHTAGLTIAQGIIENYSDG